MGICYAKIVTMATFTMLKTAPRARRLLKVLVTLITHHWGRCSSLEPQQVDPTCSSREKHSQKLHINKLSFKYGTSMMCVAVARVLKQTTVFLNRTLFVQVECSVTHSTFLHITHTGAQCNEVSAASQQSNGLRVRTVD